MDYRKALDIGHERANHAADALRRWTGVEALAICAVKPDSADDGRWKPVGGRSFKEIARDDGFHGDGRYHLVIVDADGTAKACSRKRYDLAEVLRLAERLLLPVALPGKGELWRQTEEKCCGRTPGTCRSA